MRPNRIRRAATEQLRRDALALAAALAALQPDHPLLLDIAQRANNEKGERNDRRQS